MKPKFGAFAFCKRGHLGWITSKEPDDKGYWHGYNLSHIRKPWSSKDPVVVGYIKNDTAIAEMVKFIDQLTYVEYD